jgi:AcrR family transcriptional regulator
MIVAAERLFAQRGIAAVSLQEIRAATNQRNTAAVHYHFGSKQRLIEAILEYRTRQIDQRRLAILADFEREGRADDLRALVEAAIRPLAESLAPGSYYARFIAQALGPPFTVTGIRREGIRRTQAQMERLLRGLPAAIRRQRLMIAGRMWLQALAEHEHELEARPSPAIPTAAFAANLVDMMVAMISAPVSSATRSSMRRGSGGAVRTRRKQSGRAGVSRSP